MNFKFKLSKRLARLKAVVAASVVLTLACTSDLTDPKLPYSAPTQLAISADLAPLAPASVVASANDGNVPQNTLDNNLATRWSAQGDGQWIRYDLGALAAIDHLDIAWYLGDTRASSFDIQVSLDTHTRPRVGSGQSRGQTLQHENDAYPTTSGRYVRIVGHRTSASSCNSITEVAILGTALPAMTVASVVASGNDGNVPQNTLDKSLATRWSAQGDGQWIQYDIGALTALNRLGIAWYLGDSRVASFDIAVSLDAVTWTKVFSGQSSGTTLQPELYTFPTAAGRYVRIVGHGNSLSAWTSITEVAIFGTTTITAPSCVTSAAAWQNVAIPSQTGAFEVPFDATPSTANMDGVVGFANGPAADYTNLAPIVRFNPTGTIDARNGGEYAAATAIPYTPGTTYHFRLDVNLASHTYDIYVTPAGAVEQLLGRDFAFRTEQAALCVLNNRGLYAKVGSAAVCNSGVSAWTPPAPAPVASVAVAPTTTSLTVGQTAQLSATPKDSGGSVLPGRTVTWASSNTSMATVSSSGLVKGVAAGTATITATSEGKAGTAAVTVALVPVATVVVSPAPATLPLHGTIQLNVTLKDASGNPLTGRSVAWTSSTPTVRTGSPTGLVTDVADGGTATVTATSEGKSGTSVVTVQAPLPAGSVADPTLLPVASGQVPNMAAYTALNVASQPAGFSYTDPVTGVKVWKVTSSSVPTANPHAGHDYADGPNEVSRGWGAGNNTHTILFYAGIVGVGSPYYLVDFTRGVGFTNYRQLPAGAQPVTDLCFSFSSVVGQERIAYVINGNQVKRFNTATMQVENTGFFPLTGTFQRWLHQDKNDIWFTGLQDNSTAFAWNSQTNELRTHSETWLNEPRLERDGRYIALTTSNSTIRLWDLATNTFGPTQTDVLNIWLGHNANLRGMWVTTDVNASAPFDLDRYYPSGGQIVKTRFLNNSAGAGVHHAGNWIQSDAELGGNLNRQWSFVGGVDNNAFTATALWKQAIGVMRADGSDARLLVHHYSTNSTYSDDPFVKPSPDGKVVMFDSNMAGSGRYDVFVAEMPLR